MTATNIPGEDGERDSEGSAADNQHNTASSRKKDISDFHSLWIRWTEIRPDKIRNNVDDLPIPVINIHLHQYCDCFQLRQTEADLDVGFRFLRGKTRNIIRLTPLFVIGTTMILIIYAELMSDITGISQLIPSVSVWVFGAVGVATVLWTAIIYIADRVELVNIRELAKTIIVWGLIIILLGGSVYSAYVVISAQNPTQLDNQVIFASGYFLMLLLGGLGVYDGMLRTETMLEYLSEGNQSVVKNDKYMDGSYTSWKEDLQEKLDNDICGIPTSHVFSLLFVTQFVAIWSQTGPQSLDSNLLLIVNIIADFIIVIVAFRFLILIQYIHMLMTDQYAPDDKDRARILTYQPFHYDRRGGFQDFGRFATRVNLLLLIGGLYTIYRLYVQGLRTLPAGGILQFESQLQLVIWIGSFALPILAYAIAAGAWIYYSFWAIHRKMVNDKRILSAEHQDVRGGEEPLPTVGDSIEHFEDGVDWYYLKTAPEWPINSRYIVSVVSANTVPLLLPILQFI